MSDFFYNPSDGSDGTTESTNGSIEILTPASRTTTTQTLDQLNNFAVGGQFLLNISAVPGGANSITVAIQGKDATSGAYYDLMVGYPQSTTGLKAIKLYPGIDAVANLMQSDTLPTNWRAEVRHAAAGSFTYSLTAILIL